MKAKELRELSVEELRQREQQQREAYFNQKIQLSTNQLANTAEVTQTRKDIARIKTILREKESGC